MNCGPILVASFWTCQTTLFGLAQFGFPLSSHSGLRDPKKAPSFAAFSTAT